MDTNPQTKLHQQIEKIRLEEASDSDGVHSMEDEEYGNKSLSRSRYENQVYRDEIDSDVPDRQLGESQVLEPFEDTNTDEQPEQSQAEDCKDKIFKLTGQGDILDDNYVNQTGIPQETSKKSIKRGNNRSRKQQYWKQARNYKYLCVQIDPRLVFSAFYLLRKEINSKIDRSDGFVRMNPYLNSGQITIYYHQQSKRDQISVLVDDALDAIHVIEMSKDDAEGGIQLSFKYMQYLLQNNMAIFKNRNQKRNCSGYYICGLVNSRKQLQEKILEIKKCKFIWMQLYRYQNTRSYRAILRKIFDTKQIHEMINEKMKAQEIEVAYLRQGFSMPSNAKKRGVMIVITFSGQKKLSIHQETQQIIGNFIKQTFAIFCFSFTRRKQTLTYRYTPKVDNVTWFFISESYSTKTTHLYILISKSNFEKMRNTIIDEIQNMNLNISGRRFFKGLYPEMTDKIHEEQMFKINPYPIKFPYSWKIKPKDGDIFDWKAQLTL